MKIVIVLLLVIAMLAMAGCSCGSGQLTKVERAEGAQPVTVTGAVTVTQQGNTLHVSCSTDLMNGSIIKVAIDGTDGSEVASVVYEKTCDNFYADFEIGEKWPDKVYASLVMEPKANGDQPKEVDEAYGARLENLEGENILFNYEGCLVVFQSEMLTIQK